MTSTKAPRCNRRSAFTGVCGLVFAVFLIATSLVVAPTSAGATTLSLHLGAPMVGMAATTDGHGYWTVGSDGGVFSFGDARFAGSMGGKHLNAPVVAMSAASGDDSYWLAASDGGVFSFGDAKFYGSMGAIRLNAPIVGIVSNPQKTGYWLVSSDGGVFSFGDAKFYGSMGGKHLNAPVVGIASTPNGLGYWLVASDGGVFSFGDAKFYGSMGGKHLNAQIVSIAVDTATSGYWMTASDGGVFAFHADFDGSEGAGAIVAPVDSIVASASGGYWLGGEAGAVYPFGGASFEGEIAGVLPVTRGATPASDVAARIVSIAASQVGQTDGYLYGPIDEDWCAYFTSWVWQKAGLDIPSEALAASVGQWALENGGTILPPTATPQVGDSVLFEPPYSSIAWPDSGGLEYPNIEHVNIVAQVLPGNQIITIGGSESGAVREQGPYSAADASSWWGQAIYGFIQPPGV
jgi:hypothetical protein